MPALSFDTALRKSPGLGLLNEVAPYVPLIHLHFPYHSSTYQKLNIKMVLELE